MKITRADQGPLPDFPKHPIPCGADEQTIGYRVQALTLSFPLDRDIKNSGRMLSCCHAGGPAQRVAADGHWVVGPVVGLRFDVVHPASSSPPASHYVRLPPVHPRA